VDGFSEKLLEIHFQKHSDEFPGITKMEYNEKAIRFRDAQKERHIEELRAPDGITYRFNRLTNEFIMYKDDGEIITYFIPENPKAYWKSRKLEYMKGEL